MVANEGLEKVARSLFKPGPLGLRALHPLWRMRFKLQVKTHSEYTYSLFWAELSRLQCRWEKIPVAIVKLEPVTSGSVVQRFNHLATTQPHRGLDTVRGTFVYLLLDHVPSLDSIQSWNIVRMLGIFLNIVW